MVLLATNLQAITKKLPPFFEKMAVNLFTINWAAA
jgi:hypothetical protein